MNKFILAGASCEKQKYYIAPKFVNLPETIKKEIQIICVMNAEKLNCTFLMGFYENGDLWFETICAEKDYDFDDIGAELEIKQLQIQKKELFQTLRLWYLLCCTPNGKENAIDKN